MKLMTLEQVYINYELNVRIISGETQQRERSVIYYIGNTERLTALIPLSCTFFLSM